ncbi:MAG: ABC transporter ATP-binding protein [Lachnospiraceae bacterium]|nr:ABC transporter ATP-binding protein [Lachnospiraceae bacterium]
MSEVINEKEEVIVSLLNVEKWYGTNNVVKNMSMKIRKGEFLTLLGPSGCGKTTTLRMISGFEEPSSGIIKIENESVEMKEPYQRDVNTVFQNYALFPNMTVFDNIAYGLKVKKVPKEEIKKRVEEMLDLIQLKGFEKRRIDQMSGGQKQRVAIARALINEPKVLLLDEPLGALDLKLRKQMQLELKRLQKKLNITFVYVTHDQEEALTMSDRIAVMNGGIIEQLDCPKNIYEHPKTKFVATFIGESNIFEAVVNDIQEDSATVGTECGKASILKDEVSLGDNIYVSVRPEDLRFSKEPVDGFSIRAVVKEFIYVGNITKMVAVLSNGDELKFTRLHTGSLPEVGDMIHVYWSLKDGIPIKTEENYEMKMLQSVKIS